MNADPSDEPNADHPSVYELADEYLERCRNGKRPQLTEYTDKYPALTNEIREIFPMMLLMEDNAPVSESETEHELNLEQLGDFRIVREIGRGGMGVVYEAVQESLNRQVALKVCPMSSRLSSRNRERFRRESRAAAMLHHTNIVPVFAVGEDEGNLFYAMQYIRGATLEDVVAELRLIWQHSPTVNTNLSNVRVNRSASAEASEVAQSLAGIREPVSGRALAPGNTDGSQTLSSRENTTRGDAGNEKLPQSESRTLPGASARPLTSAGTPAVHESAEIALPGASTAESSTGAFRYWDSVARVGVQVADAMDYAHGMGTLHRDIKPANLMLDATGAVWVMDFGLAKSMEEDNLTQTGELIGTMRYMSPEQCVGEPDQRSDIYSLGLTLYEMLALRPAFEELNRSKLLRAIAETDPIAPRKLNPQIPRDLETIVLKSIEREPGRRYQTARELHDDLARFLQGEPIHARPISASERIGKWVRRRPLVAALTAALAVMFCVSFALVTWNWLDARAARDEAIASANEANRLAESEKVARDDAIASAKKATQLAASEKSARKKTEDTLYRSAISRALLVSQTDPAESRRVLEELEGVAAAGWEHGYLTQMVNQEKHTLQAGSAAAPWIWTLAFSDDEKYLAVGAGRTEFLGAWRGTGRLTIWDIESGQLVREMPVAKRKPSVEGEDPTGVVPYSLAFSPDGTKLAISECMAGSEVENFWTAAFTRTSTGREYRVCVRDINDATNAKPDIELERPVPEPGHYRVSDLRFTRDGKHVLGSVWQSEASKASGAAFPVATAVWATGDGTLVVSLKATEFLSLDGERAVVTRYEDGQAQIVRGVFSPDSDEVLSDQEVQYTQPMRAHPKLPGTGVFNIAQNQPATRAWVDRLQRLMLRDLKSGADFSFWGDDRHKVRTRWSPRPVCAFHPAAPILASASDDGSVRLWSTSENAFERTLAGHSVNVQSVAYSRSGALLASGDWNGEVRIWRPAQRAHILDTSLSGPAATQSTVEAITFTADGSKVVACQTGMSYGAHYLKTIDYHAGKAPSASGDPMAIKMDSRSQFKTRARDSAFDDHGTTLVTLVFRANSKVEVLDVATKQVRSLELNTQAPLREIAISGNAKRFATAATIDERTRITAQTKCEVAVYDTQTQDPAEPLWREERTGCCITSIGLSRDGTHIAIASLSASGTAGLDVIEIATGERVSLNGLSQFASAVEFDPTGSRLAAVPEFGEGAIFDCRTGKLLAKFPVPVGVEDLAWNPDGDRLAGANREVVKLWDTNGQNLITLKADPRTRDVQWDPRVVFSRDGKLIAANQWNDKIRVWKSR